MFHTRCLSRSCGPHKYGRMFLWHPQSRTVARCIPSSWRTLCCVLCYKPTFGTGSANRTPHMLHTLCPHAHGTALLQMSLHPRTPCKTHIPCLLCPCMPPACTPPCSGKQCIPRIQHHSGCRRPRFGGAVEGTPSNHRILDQQYCCH